MNPDPARLRHFIRATLGCGCPEETLDNIQCTRSHDGPADDLRLTRVDVGGRLLVYVLEAAGSEAQVVESLPAVVAAGLAERTRGGFNRLRIVVAGDDEEALRPLAEACFAASAPRDDLVHLHVVGVDELPFG